MRVAILGAGAVGGYYGGQLARAGHDIRCLARGATLAALRERGLEVRTPEGGYRIPVTATDRPEALGSADFAILAVKSYSLGEMVPAVRHCAAHGAVIVPLLNGVETVERLEEQGVPPASVIGGLTAISAVRVGPGIVERRSPFQMVVVGELDGRTSERVGGIAAAFQEAGVDARASQGIQVELWQKFAFIAALAAACGLLRAPVARVRRHPLGRRLFQRAVEEVVAVALARGITLPEGEVTRLMGVLDTLPGEMKPSFLVDLESGGPTELETLSGAVSRYAARAGIATPIHDTATVVLARPA